MPDVDPRSALSGGGSSRTRDASRFWLKRLRLNEHGKVVSLAWRSYGTQYRRALWVKRYRDRGFQVEIPDRAHGSQLRVPSAPGGRH